MLAGEPFTDRPPSVCPVIGGFLRTYNDATIRRHRQELKAYAPLLLGTRSSDEVEQARARQCVAWADALSRSCRLVRRLSREPQELPMPARLHSEAAGVFAARAITRHTDGAHGDALALVDRLLEIAIPTCGASSCGGRPRLRLEDRLVDDSTVLIEAAGDLDTTTLPQLTRAVDAALLAGSESIVVDFTHANAVSRDILAEFTRALSSAGARTRRLAITWPQAPFTGVLFSGSTEIVVAVHRTLEEGRGWAASTAAGPRRRRPAKGLTSERAPRRSSPRR